MGTAVTASRALFGGLAFSVALAACGSSSPQHLADETTQALYRADRNAAIADFDDTLKPQVTQAQVGAISDAMHMLGNYKGLDSLHGDGNTGRYDYVANFDKGKMLVMMRMDPNGKIGAYRVTPTEQ